jgi:Abnormal spindle-like microcephaly-assoc'd, ASPM-SPD-2-Hydin/Beta-propeller repeat
MDIPPEGTDRPMMRITRLSAAVLSLSAFCFSANATNTASNLPMAFELNRGQAPERYSYVLHHNGMEFLFSRNGADLVALRGAKATRLRLEFVSSRIGVVPMAEQPITGQSNYLLGAEVSRWITHIPNYRRLHYDEVYPGVSLDFYGNGNALEHDFTVRPGADPSAIAFRLPGAERIDLSPDGDLEIHTAGATLTLTKPVAYQEGAAGRNTAEVKFEVDGQGVVHFRVGAYDRRRALVIDPVFSFSTFLTGTGNDQVNAVTTDAAGNIYVTGTTTSTDFPTQKPEQAAHSGSSDAFITKLDPTGTTLLYSTYLGGTYDDYGASLAVDTSGNAIVAGVTRSLDFPHAGSLPALSCPGNNLCYFIASLKPDGSALNYCGAIGGAQGTYANNGVVVVDPAGNAYLAGATDDPNFPATPGTLSPTVPGYPTSSTFVIKVGPSGAPVYATIVPGNAAADVQSVYTNLFLITRMTVDSAGVVTAAGWGGQGLPTTAGVVSPSFPNAIANVESPTAGFVFQLNATASAINYATYIPGTDILDGFAVDPSGNLYVGGATSETNLPVTANAYQKTPFVNQEGQVGGGYIVSLKPQAAAVNAATYLGSYGTGFEGLALDSHQNIFLGGGTGSIFPLQDPFTSKFVTGSTTADMVLAEMSTDLSTLKFGSFLSSTDAFPYEASTFSDLTVDANDNLVVVGTTYASDFPTTAGSFEPQPPAPANPLTIIEHTFITKINMATAAPSVCPSTWSVQFGSVNAQTSSTQTVNITNCGNAPLSFNSITSSDPTVVASQQCGTVAPGGVCAVDLTFTPANDQMLVGSVSFADNAVISPQVIQVTGYGTAPDLEPGVNPLSFGHLLGGTQGPVMQLLLMNNGNAALVIQSVSINGSGFSISQNECPGQFPRSGLCAVSLVFSPPGPGAFTGSLTITSNDPVHPQLVVALTGTGDAAYSVPAISSAGPGNGVVQQTLQLNANPVTLQIAGSNFYPQSVVQLNGAALPTTFVGNSLLQVTVAASSLPGLGEFPLTVLNPKPGGGTSQPVTMTTFAIVPLNASALVSVPATGLLYAAMPSSDVQNPNTLIPINPTTGTQGTPIPVGKNPALLAASSDGSYLYVANATDLTVQRINLGTNTVEKTFPYPPNPFCGTCTLPPAVDLEPIPGSPQEVVLAQGAMASLYNSSGLVNYVPSGPIEFANPTFNSIAFAGTPLALYAQPFTDVQNPFFNTAAITSTGLQYTPVTGANFGPPSGTGGRVVSDGMLLYTDTGEVWNPATQSQVGSFPLLATYYILSGLTLDATRGQLFAIGDGSSNLIGGGFATLAISSYGTVSLAAIDTLAFPAIDSPQGFDLVRWGSNGFAFVVSSVYAGAAGVYLTQSGALMGPPAMNPVPSLTAISPASATAGSAAFTVTVTGTGFVAASTIDWDGTALTTSYVSATQLTASVPSPDIASSGTAQVTVSTAGPGGGTSSPLTFAVNAATPVANLSPNSLQFGDIAQGSASGAQSITLTNTGTGVLSFASITATGDFSQNNTCNGGLAIGASCQVSVVFSPSVAGQRSGSLTITDNAPNSPQTVSLAGTGMAPVAIGLQSGGSASVTVASGGTATYNLALSAQPGFSGSLQLSCSGAPEYAACSVNPSTTTLTAGGSANFVVTVTTTAQQAAVIPERTTLRLAGLGIASLLVWPLLARVRRLCSCALCLLAVCIAVTAIGCGGGSGGSNGGTSPPTSYVTPAGSYTLTVTAATQSNSVQQSLTLVVQ